MHRTEVLILGGGLVGLTLALALDRHGIASTVIDPADPATILADDFDGRASAVASASWAMLEAIGVAERLRPHGCPIRRIEVRDGLQEKPLAFDAEPDVPLGTMVANGVIRRTLHEAARAAALVDLRQPASAVSVERGQDGVVARLDDASEVRASLLIAAEGRRSPTRAAAGLNMARWSYGATAIISAFDHEKPHDNVAHEIFYPDGPFALLPMLAPGDGGAAPGTRSSLVWTVEARDAAGVLKLGDRAFAREAEKRLGGLLGALTTIAPRSSYPLGFQHAARIIDTRLVLVGDAAHGIHPIAGQGLNLGFRDVAALVEVLVDGTRLGLDLGDGELLKRYQRWRSADTLAVSVATDSLNRLFGIRGPAARAVRRFGLGAVERIRPLKDFFMAEARGESGALPKLLRGSLV